MPRSTSSTEKLQRQVKKYHDKMQHKALRHHAPNRLSAAATPDDAIADEAAALARRPRRLQPVAADRRARRPTAATTTTESRVVKSKQFALKPMSIDEATLQLELIGHSFFVFTNAETNDTNVVYRRRDGDFGLIEPVRQLGRGAAPGGRAPPGAAPAARPSEPPSASPRSVARMG